MGGFISQWFLATKIHRRHKNENRDHTFITRRILFFVTFVPFRGLLPNQRDTEITHFKSRYIHSPFLFFVTFVPFRG